MSPRAWLQPPLLPWLDPGRVPRPPDWLERVHTPQSEDEVAALRRCVARNAPYGRPAWVERTAQELGLESSLRPPGRPTGSVGKETGPTALFGPTEP